MNTRTRSAHESSGVRRQSGSPEHLCGLMARVAGGDQGAFESLYDEVAGAVHGVALRTLRDRSHAEEVAQEVLLEVWRNAAAYRPDRGSVLTWVLTIAHRRAVDRVRSVRASKERDHRVALRDFADVEAPDDRVVRSLEQAHVRHALKRLGDPQRQALVLAYYGGYSQNEIATLTGVPLGTVKTRIRDGLIRLRAVTGLAEAAAAQAAGGRG